MPDYLEKAAVSPKVPKEPKFTSKIEVRTEEDFGKSEGGDFRNREAKRYAAELAEIDKLLKAPDASLAAFVKNQLQAQRDICEARMKLQAAEGMKIGEVFEDLRVEEEAEEKPSKKAKLPKAEGGEA